MELDSSLNGASPREAESGRFSIYEAQEKRLYGFLRRVYGDCCSVEEILTDAVIRWWKEVKELDEVDSLERLYRYSIEAAEEAIESSPSDRSIEVNNKVRQHENRFERALRFLSIEQRLVIVLIDSLGFSREQVSQLIDRDLEYVGRTLSSARSLMRRTLHRFSADLRAVPLKVAEAAATVQAVGEEIARAVRSQTRD